MELYMKTLEVMKGQRCGKWTVLHNERVGKTLVSVRCQCGVEKKVVLRNLVRGSSAGCWTCGRDQIPKGNKHGNWKGIGLIPKTVFNNIIYHAKRRSISCSQLTIEYVEKIYNEQQGKCALTGRPIPFGFGLNGKVPHMASLDRIDNEKGYVEENIQWLHKDVNWAKRTLSQKEFIKLCNDVVSYENENNTT